MRMYISAALVNRADTVGVAVGHQASASSVLDNRMLASVHPRLNGVGADIFLVRRLPGVNLMHLNAKLAQQVG